MSNSLYHLDPNTSYTSDIYVSPSCDLPSEQDPKEKLTSESCEKTARDLERDLIRQARGYHNKITSTTTTMVRKPIVSGTSNFYQVMLREWSLFIDEYDGVHDPTNVKAAKDFILYFTSGRRGRNERGGRLTRAYT